MRIFITGATGVVGRRAVPLLVAAGHQVTAAGRDATRLAALERAGASTVALDLFNGDAVRRALAGHDVVVNLATHLPRSSLAMMLPWSWRENDRIRRDGSARLVDAALALGVRRFVQESFAPIYADAGARWIDEQSPVRVGRYNRSVLDAERSVERFDAAGGVGIVLRFAGFYGPDSRMLHEMLPFVRRRISPLPGRFDAFWSSLHHDDAASAVVAALSLPAGTYNVSDDEPLTRAEWTRALADASGVAAPKPMPRWLAWTMGSLAEVLARSQRISNAALRARGWSPRWRSASDGLRASLAGEATGRSPARAIPAARGR